VEAAYFVPKPVQAPEPPNYSSSPAPYQDYLDAAPGGIDARNAWTRGWNGAGIKVCDVEAGVNRDHQDLPTIRVLGRFPVDPWLDDHGNGRDGESSQPRTTDGARKASPPACRATSPAP
jgi:subtilisin family serine protease